MALIQYGGVNPRFDRSGEYVMDATAVAGTILTDDVTAGKVVTATNAAAYVLEHDVVTDPFDDARKLKFLQGLAAPLETKAGGKCDVIRLHPGAVLEVDQFATGAATGAITAATAVQTDIAVNGGKFRAFQAGDTKVGELIENKVSADGTVVVRITALG